MFQDRPPGEVIRENLGATLLFLSTALLCFMLIVVVLELTTTRQRLDQALRQIEQTVVVTPTECRPELTIHERRQRLKELLNATP